MSRCSLHLLSQLLVQGTIWPVIRPLLCAYVITAEEEQIRGHILRSVEQRILRARGIPFRRERLDFTSTAEYELPRSLKLAMGSDGSILDGGLKKVSSCNVHGVRNSTLMHFT
ncbi:hypothetical protein FB451DRAFT_1493756 [Mycena latifolia]|nr:hypothetical protein FB451DRAFT_1493756 [Mycena latifolia]